MVNETSLPICLEWNGFRLLTVSTLIPGGKPSRLLGELDLLPHWPLHTWMGLAGLLGGILGSWQADGAVAGLDLEPLRCTGC